MRILHVDDDRYFAYDRYFVYESQRELESIALKLLNERRILCDDDPKLKGFVETITDEQDGDLAISLVRRLYNPKFIQPEVI